jgi:hypothetical protein
MKNRKLDNSIIKLSLKLFLSACCIFFSIQNTVAQTSGTIGDEKVTVVREFNPLIQDANKINFPPEPVEVKEEKTELQYTVPVQLFPLSYPQANLKPLAIAKEKTESYFNSFARLGFGTQWSPLAEVRFVEGKRDKFLFGAHGKYRSAHGSKIKSQDFSKTYASLFTDAYVRNSLFRANASYTQNINYYYGYDVLKSTPKLTQKQLRQTFNIADVQLQLLNAKRRGPAFDYDGKVQFNYLVDRFKLNEYFINADIWFQKSFKEMHHVSLQLFDDFSSFKDVNGATLNRNIFLVKAKYHFKYKDWNMSGAVSPVWEAGIFHFFPDIALQRNLYKEYITLYSGWKMELRKNSYLSHVQTNPWLEQITVNDLKNGWLEERFTGLKGTVKKFSYNLRFAQNLYRHMPVYVNDTLNMQRFKVLYDRRTNMLNFHAELGYRAMSNLQFNVTFDFINYEADRVARIYHQPRFNARFNTQYTIAEKIMLQLDVIGMDGVYALTPGNKEIQLKPTVDVNLGATYVFSKRFSFFVYLNNLASVKYQRYYLYPSYGFNALAGATLHF